MWHMLFQVHPRFRCPLHATGHPSSIPHTWPHYWHRWIFRSRWLGRQATAPRIHLRWHESFDRGHLPVLGPTSPRICHLFWNVRCQSLLCSCPSSHQYICMRSARARPWCYHPLGASSLLPSKRFGERPAFKLLSRCYYIIISKRTYIFQNCCSGGRCCIDCWL